MPWSGQHSPAPVANNWWYLVYTYDGTTVRIYVNAEENTTSNETLIRMAPTSSGWLLGRTTRVPVSTAP
jgi:hypothetical protein